ncbi:PACE efflux transporter [Psychromonas ossibalaenae]|uniref:PACE efflux transporter n=1 Tax=Psychromonas ossibalaenae TaxID=444922 RepID=UPI00036867D0|nr:PACE efflux transporter [Psychromonas ossibalaenae]
MSARERLLHMLLFELIAVSSVIIGLIVFSDIALYSALKTMIVVSLIAMVWNYLFNLIFDQFYRGAREKRGLKLRIFYVLIFESGLVILTTPVMAYILQVSLLEAFILDLGITLFITLYTLVFNYCYDHLRLKFVNSKETPPSLSQLN